MNDYYKIKLLSICLIISIINSTIIKEGYHFFDIFYYRDIYKNYLKQKKNYKCSLEEGPNCLYIKNSNEYEKEKELKNIFPDNNSIINEPLEYIFSKLKNSSKLITEKESTTIDDEIFEFDSPYVMSLLLSFESYDEKTLLHDIYAPETIDTPFDIGRVTLTIFGKLRLSQKNSKKFEPPMSLKDEKPQNTYAFVETKEVIIKFNVKSTIGSLYIKKNKYNQNNKPFYLYGFKNGKKHLISKIENVPSSQWIKVNGNGKKYESIGLMRGFDYDNIVIMASLEGTVNYNQLTKQFSSLINDKIRNTINEEVNKLTGKKGKYLNKDENGIKVIKINIEQEDIIKNEEENIDFPDDLIDEIENKYKEEKNLYEKNQRENKNKIEKSDKNIIIKDEDL